MILSTKELTKQFKGLTAVNDVSWSIERGQTKAIIGPNGAGKTTFFNLLAGELSPTSGQVLYQSEDITGIDSHKRVQRGIVKSFQRTNIYEEMSTYKNIRLAAQSKVSTFDLISDGDELSEANDKASEIMSRLGLSELKDDEAATLSYGDKRKIEIGLALATEPEVLLLDEPTAGMSEIERDEILERIKGLSSETDITMIVTEHDMGVVLDLADEITVLHEGQVIAEGQPSEITEDEEVQRVYLGES